MMRKLVRTLIAVMLVGGIFVISFAHSSKALAAGPCTSGWINFHVADGNLIYNNTNTAAVIQIQEDSQAQWCGPVRAMYVLRIGAGDPSESFSGDFYDYANGQNQGWTSVIPSDTFTEKESPSQPLYYIIYSPTLTWQYCVGADVEAYTSQEAPVSHAFTDVGCI